MTEDTRDRTEITLTSGRKVVVMRARTGWFHGHDPADTSFNVASPNIEDLQRQAERMDTLARKLRARQG